MRRFHRRRVSRPQTHCTIRTCLHHTSKPHAFCEIMGPTKPYDPTWLRNFIAHSTSNEPTFRAAIFDRMLSTGEALWHAVAVVLDSPCCCSHCCNPNDERYGDRRPALGKAA